MSETTDTKATYRGPLHDLLTAKLPAFHSTNGRLNVKLLAEACSMSREGIYKCFRKNKITVRCAKRVIELSEADDNRSRLKPARPAKFEDFTAFLLA